MSKYEKIGYVALGGALISLLNAFTFYVIEDYSLVEKYISLYVGSGVVGILGGIYLIKWGK